jgi:hypothetical protein
MYHPWVISMPVPQVLDSKLLQREAPRELRSRQNTAHLEAMDLDVSVLLSFRSVMPVRSVRSLGCIDAFTFYEQKA